MTASSSSSSQRVDVFQKLCQNGGLIFRSPVHSPLERLIHGRKIPSSRTRLRSSGITSFFPSFVHPPHPDDPSSFQLFLNRKLRAVPEDFIQE